MTFRFTPPWMAAFLKISVFMSFNVPAVYDVWAGIKGLCEAKTARPNVPE
jgi:hypothetical protein